MRPPPEVFGETDEFQENFQEENMERKNTDELRNHFSAYVKQAVKNTKGQIGRASCRERVSRR